MARRTLAVSIASVIGVVLAGLAIVAVSFGILDASSASDVGQLSAGSTSVPAPTSTPTADPAALAGRTGAQGGQVYEVGDAGTVEVGIEGDGLALLAVSPVPGWSHETQQSDPAALVVRFRKGDVVLTFIAGRDGEDITAGVQQSSASAPAPSVGGGAVPVAPSPSPSPTPAPTAPRPAAPSPAAAPAPTAPAPSGGGSYVDDDDDDDEHEDEVEDEHEDEDGDEDDGRDD